MVLLTHSDDLAGWGGGCLAGGWIAGWLAEWVVWLNGLLTGWCSGWVDCWLADGVGILAEWGLADCIVAGWLQAVWQGNRQLLIWAVCVCVCGGPLPLLCAATVQAQHVGELHSKMVIT